MSIIDEIPDGMYCYELLSVIPRDELPHIHHVKTCLHYHHMKDVLGRRELVHKDTLGWCDLAHRDVWDQTKSCGIKENVDEDTLNDD